MKRSDLIKELSVLDPQSIQISKDNFGNLSLHQNGELVSSNIRVLRAFPITYENQFIVFRNEKDLDIGILTDLSQLDKNSRKSLQEQLAKAYFMPEILKIYDIDSKFGAAKWDVETDKGRRTFDLSSRQDVKSYPRNRILIRDIDGNRYEISNYRKLDKKSIAWLEQQI